MFEVLGLAEQAAQTLHESAVAARQAGHLTHAMAAAHQLTTMHHSSSAAPGMPMEPAKRGILLTKARPMSVEVKLAQAPLPLTHSCCSGVWLLSWLSACPHTYVSLAHLYLLYVPHLLPPICHT